MLRTKFNITFIPVWLENTMSRTGMNFSDALNKEKLLGILSKSDIVFYLLANSLFRSVYLQPAAALETGMFDTKLLEEKFLDNKDIQDGLAVSYGELHRDGNTPFTMEQKFLQHALGETIDLESFKDIKFNFIIQLIDDHNLIVRFKLVEGDIPTYKFFGHFYEQLLRTLNYQYPFPEIAKTALFGKYCRCIGMGVTK